MLDIRRNKEVGFSFIWFMLAILMVVVAIKFVISTNSPLYKNKNSSILKDNIKTQESEKLGKMHHLKLKPNRSRVQTS